MHSGKHNNRPEPKKRRSYVVGEIKQTARIFIIVAVCVALIRIFVFQVFLIPSPSMHNTLFEHDRVAVSRASYWVNPPRRGDVVVFKDSLGWLPPSSASGNPLVRAGRFVGIIPQTTTQYLVKRVIGTSGDHVKCCTPSGKITVNGVEVTESYIAKGQVPTKTPFNIIVPDGHLWVMGDNRGNSADSLWHYLNGGDPFIDERDVVGRVIFLIWPVSRWFTTINDRRAFDKVPAAQ